MSGENFHSKIQLPCLVQKGEVTKEGSATRKEDQDTQKQRESQDPEGRKAEPQG